MANTCRHPALESRIRGLCLADAAFVLFAAIYAFLALHGILAMSGDGAMIDGDLQTYAQAMAGEHYSALFTNDPVLGSANAANSIPNMQRMLADHLTPGDSYAVGLLRAGAVAIFIFYVFWYVFGRWFFGRPVLAAILSLLMGITVWTGWGTFWGVTHSDPVPRVFFAAFFPLLLIVALKGFSRPYLRPVAMFCAGLGMWIHGVNALNCGAMFFTAFLLFRPASISPRAHFANCILCLAAFLAPVLYYLWPSLLQGRPFSDSELDVFREYLAVRWRQDYAGFGSRILAFLHPANPTCQVLVAGIVCGVPTAMLGNQQEKNLCKMILAFVLALACVSLFCWAETRYAPEFGRLPMGHELVRGLRFLTPLSWLLAVCAVSILACRFVQRLLLCALIAALAILTTDRQYEGAQFALSRFAGIELPLVADATRTVREATDYREMIMEVGRIVPERDLVFSSGEDMAVRYLAHRPLAYTFKDGYAHFYNKDLEAAKKWLQFEKLMSKGADGLKSAWMQSGAPWLLLRQEQLTPQLAAHASKQMEKNGWLLLKKAGQHRSID